MQLIAYQGIVLNQASKDLHPLGQDAGNPAHFLLRHVRLAYPEFCPYCCQKVFRYLYDVLVEGHALGNFSQHVVPVCGGLGPGVALVCAHAHIKFARTSSLQSFATLPHCTDPCIPCSDFCEPSGAFLWSPERSARTSRLPHKNAVIWSQASSRGSAFEQLSSNL